MAYCYILFSKKLNKYYIGSTTEIVNERLEKHISEFYDGFHYTHSTKDWVVYLSILCSDIIQAKKIEAHIKRMKSKKYIHDLKKYTELIEKLFKKYS